MIHKPESGMIRGAVAISSKYGSGRLSVDPTKAEENGYVVAHTHWYRHDDDLTELEKDVDAIVKCYQRMKKSESVLIVYQYKDYNK